MFKNWKYSGWARYQNSKILKKKNHTTNRKQKYWFIWEKKIREEHVEKLLRNNKYNPLQQPGSSRRK